MPRAPKYRFRSLLWLMVPKFYWCKLGPAVRWQTADGLRFGHWCSKGVANITPYTKPWTHCSFMLWLSGRTCQQTNLFNLTFCHLSHQLKQHIKRPFSIKLQSLVASINARKRGEKGNKRRQIRVWSFNLRRKLEKPSTLTSVYLKDWLLHNLILKLPT